MNFLLNTLDTNLVLDMIVPKVIKLRKDKEELQEQKEEWFSDNAYNTTRGEWIKQNEDGFGSRYLRLCGGCKESLDLEHDEDNNKFRFNWFCKDETEMLDNLYCVWFDDEEYLTVNEIPKIITDDEDIRIYNLLELDDY